MELSIYNVVSIKQDIKDFPAEKTTFGCAFAMKKLVVVDVEGRVFNLKLFADSVESLAFKSA